MVAAAVGKGGHVDGIQFRDERGAVHRMAAREVHLNVLTQMRQWREFNWYQNQRHFPGSYWSSTMNDHVGHESRHERNRLILADFDPNVTRIVAQPFQLEYRTDKPRRHIPDYLLIGRDSSVTIINVKTPRALDSHRIVSLLDAVNERFSQLGWHHEVWTGEAPARMANVRLLAGYRRSWLFDPILIDRVLALAPWHTIAETRDLACLDTRPELVTPVILHLLWDRRLTTDLLRPISLGSRLTVVA